MIRAIGRIPGYGKRYMILSSGVIFNEKMNMMATQKSNSGYELVHLSLDGKRKAYTMHRLVAMTFLPNPNSLPYINHKDGDKFNNDVNNLEWVTAEENCKHAHVTGLLVRKGVKNSMAKLKDEDIPAIRVLIKRGVLLKDIAKIFGVHYTVISVIKSGKTWTHIK